MLKDNSIFIGKADDKEICIPFSQLNRHGFITGATGTGKTVTLKVIAEALSDAGVPVFITDIKGDVASLMESGNLDQISERLQSMNISDFHVNQYPVRFFDVFREKGIPMRTILEEMEPSLLSRLLELTDAQSGVLSIAYQYAIDEDLALIDIGDLEAVLSYMSTHFQDISMKYGNVSKQSINTIQRKLLQFSQQKGNMLFGMPAFHINDLFQSKDGKGMINLLECDALFQSPLVYSSYLVWLLDTLYNQLEEVGDLEQPKIVLFFDEAHLLFEQASKSFLSQIERSVKLMRSKGVGIFFCTQNANEIPSDVLSQCQTRIQHAIHAYTPNEMKNLKAIAGSFRENSNFDTVEVLQTLSTGQALISHLDTDGVPTIVEKTKILPPASSLNPIDSIVMHNAIQNDPLFQKYKDDMDPESADEKIEELLSTEQDAKEKEAADKVKQKQVDRVVRKVQNRAENEIIRFGMKSAKKILKSFLK